MRWIGPAALVLGLLAASAPASAASSCAEKGSRTLLDNRVARVYEDQSDDTISCSKATGHHRVLASDSYEYLQHLTLSGHFVAFWWTGCLTVDEHCSSSLDVHDVRTGRRVFSGDLEPAVLVLRSNGSVAWSVLALPPARWAARSGAIPGAAPPEPTTVRRWTRGR
jgi:hypothetical protein